MTTGTIRAQRRAARVSIVESTERDAMSQALRAVLAAHSPASRVAAVADGPDPYDAPLWRRLSVELGVTGVLVPAQLGGLGLGWREARVILAEMGRSLACVPFLSSCIIAPSVLLSGTGDGDVAEDLLPKIAEGGTIVAVALGDESLHSGLPATSVEARLTGGNAWHLTGTAMFVADAPSADQILVLANEPDDTVAWFAVATDSPGVSVSPMSVVDTTRPLARVELADAPARVAGRFSTCDDAVASVFDAAITGLACEQSAASQFLLEQTVAYCKTRYQFGQPIGSFQAVQHRLADLATAVDTSVSAVEYAIWAASEDRGRWAEAASIAGFTCSETMLTVSGETIQLHGGIGFTWEHFAHRYYRRALAARSQFGDPSWHRERLLAALAI